MRLKIWSWLKRDNLVEDRSWLFCPSLESWLIENALSVFVKGWQGGGGGRNIQRSLDVCELS